jgi:hypothetical protein
MKFRILIAGLIAGAGFLALAQAEAGVTGVKRYVPAQQAQPVSPTGVPLKEGTCEPEPRPLFFYVMMNDFQERFSEGKDMDALGGLFKAGAKSKTENKGIFHTYVLGLTVPNFKAKSDFQAYTFSKSDHVCIYLNQVQVDVTATPDIYVADEITEKQCRQDVFSHEKNHVRIYREDFMSRGPELKKHLEEKFSKRNGWYIASGPGLDKRIQDKYVEIRKEINDDAAAELMTYIDAMAPRHEIEVDNAPGEKERGAACLTRVPGLVKREAMREQAEKQPAP